ncbi:restriction endonuclease subunit S [Weizmannia acidilactici]|uniref:restriction endonuclease subunit S n=1 Tax=Weizmannia acidilactici TaxID=2607726 RepID=UPI00124E4760|nr:restriction endonuclease subunit S [Weizmannia acidilactici]GER73758.1 type I restriction-modification enzyme, S subunit [Weizmannia acidilactici]
MAKENLKNLYPSDWKEYKFDKLFDFEGGLSISRANLSNEGICYLHYGDIHKSDDNYIDIEKSYDLIPKYNESLNNINRKFLLNDGDIVFADASEDYEGIGKSVVVINPKNIPFISGLHTIVAKDKSNLLNNGYKRFFLLDWNIRKQMMLIATGISVYGISKNKIKNVKVYLPPIEEQQKISSILSTWDKAIELKEKLIEQKKQQKKGLMQKLLTGEVRLPGFEGKWKEVRIKDLGTLKGGSAFPEKYQNVISGKYPFFKVSDMNNEENEKYMLNANNYINEEIRSEIKATIIPKNSIIFAKVGAALLLERKRILKYDSCIDNNMMALIVKENIDFNYVYYLLLNMKLSRFSNVGALPSLNSNDVYSLKCRLPMDYDEQKAVAELLSLFDKEIDLLQNELIQIKQQKKGLMQLLLTGKVRVKV